MTDAEPASFHLAYVPGVTPDKWVRKWRERVPEVPLELIGATAADAPGLVRDGRADAALLRLPIERTGLHVIPLYTEKTMVLLGKDHFVAAADEVTAADLTGEILLHPLDDALEWAGPPGVPAVERPATTADAVALVAAGVGLLAVPQSLARLHHRRDLTYRPLADAPESAVALTWLAAETSDLMEQFIGIVRGRTVNSTRGRPPQPAPAKPKGTARGNGRTAGKAGGRHGAAGGGRSRKPRRR